MSLLAQKYPWSKWRKHVALWGEPELQPFLPQTAVLNPENLQVFLEEQNVVFAKPSCGGGGKGVVKLERMEERVRIYAGADRYEESMLKAYRRVAAMAGKRSYIVQQGIPLITIEECPVDFRTLLLKPGKSWRYMGIMGKVAVREQVVTNHCRGGSSITFSNALAASRELKGEDIRRLENELESLSLQIAEALQRKFPLIRELGLDIGLDGKLHPWLIEANTRPQYNLFKDHDDRTLYKRIDAIVNTVRLPLH